MDTKERRRDKAALVEQVEAAGGRIRRKNMYHCFNHDDKTASSWVKQSANGLWYFRCFTCGYWGDVWDIEARNRGIDVRELLKEHDITPVSYKKVYTTLDELIDSIDYSAIEEINNYTNPDTGNKDLITVRYLPRGGDRKCYVQAYEKNGTFIKSRPPGLLPLFNRTRFKEADTIVFVEGEKCVRALQHLGIVSTTGSGGAQNHESHDLTPLAGKHVILWPDNDVPGTEYIDSIRIQLERVGATTSTVNISELDLPPKGDVADLIDITTAEGGTIDDCRDQVSLILSEASDVNRLSSFEDFLADMQEGRRENFPFYNFPILTQEAAVLLNQQLTVVFGGAGFGKTLLIGNLSDSLVLAGKQCVRLQLEDDLPKHLLRTLCQVAEDSKLAKADFHKEFPDVSKSVYEKYKLVLDEIAKSIVADESKDWNVSSILEWLEVQLKSGKELVIVDPASVVMGEKVWLESHRLVWGTKKLLRLYPQGRVIFITHPNADGDVSGGQAFKRFCHNLLLLTKFKQPKVVRLLKVDGEEEVAEVAMSITIAKTRDGSGGGLELAVRLNPTTLKMEELGVILGEVKNQVPSKRYSGRDLERENVIDFSI